MSILEQYLGEVRHKQIQEVKRRQQADKVRSLGYDIFGYVMSGEAKRKHRHQRGIERFQWPELVNRDSSIATVYDKTRRSGASHLVTPFFELPNGIFAALSCVEYQGSPKSYDLLLSSRPEPDVKDITVFSRLGSEKGESLIFPDDLTRTFGFSYELASQEVVETAEFIQSQLAPVIRDHTLPFERIDNKYQQRYAKLVGAISLPE